MRQTVNITAINPQSELITDFSVSAIQFSNPTLSPIAFRQGGSDFPDLNSADFLVPAQTLLRLPAVGNQFAVQFTDVNLLQIGDIHTAKITAFDANEATLGIGSVQPIARPQWYEKERNPSVIGQQDNEALTPTIANGTPEPLLYTVPNNRKAYITFTVTKLVRTIAATTLGTVSSSWVIDAVSGGQAFLSNSILLSETVGAADTQPAFPQLVLNPGDILFTSRRDSTPDSSGEVLYMMSFAGTEFDD